MREQALTLDDIKAMKCEMLTPAIVAKVIGCDPYNISLHARDDPSRLGFNVCRIGRNTKIPRIGFIRWMEGAKTPEQAQIDLILNMLGCRTWPEAFSQGSTWDEWMCERGRAWSAFCASHDKNPRCSA